MFVWIFVQKVELPMFNGSGIITQAMSPESSENEQQNSFKCKHTFHKLWFSWLFFFNEEMNFTADEVEIRQDYAQGTFHPEVFLSFIMKISIYLRLLRNIQWLEV